MNFGILALIVLAGLGGPLIAAGRHGFVPVVVGELAAGVLIGKTGAHWLDPAQSTIVFLADIGFAMLMFSAGMHVPIRQPGIIRGFRRGLVAAVIVAALSIPVGLGIAAVTPNGHAAIYALLLASGSAAVLLPILEEEQLLGDGRALVLMAQVGIADVAAIVALPLVMQPGKALHVALGTLAVALAAIVALALARLLRGHPLTHRFRQESKQRGWALDLRLSLLLLFALAWLASRTGTSILIAGFAVGLLVAIVGGPKRLSTQVTGIASGFFVPLYFVTLGAKIDLRAVFQHPSTLELAILLLVANVAVHLVGARSSGQSFPAGFAATAQLGLPAGVATLGLDQHIITPAQAAAILLAALATIALCPAGVAYLRRRSERNDRDDTNSANTNALETP
ncbi:MAG: cation:proton antiporter [Gaiellaceae bacterium]